MSGPVTALSERANSDCAWAHKSGGGACRLCDPQGGNDVALTWIRTHDWDADAWRDRASCRDTSPELFFPIGTTGVALEQIDAAKRVCHECPVASECLEFALATNQEAGVWGGLTEDERRRLRKGVDVAVAPVVAPA
jgi:WhiB family redox-sensing transcriptional regulator